MIFHTAHQKYYKNNINQLCNFYKGLQTHNILIASWKSNIYNKIDLVPILEQSLEKMKKFIEFILSKLGKFCENKEEKQNAYLSEKIFDFMIDNSEKLGIVFFYQLLKEEKFINILINLFFEDIFIAQIKKLLEKIIYIFNIDYKHAEINNPLNSLYNDFINCGIIEQNDLKENEARESLTEEEKMFFELESSQILWEKYRKNGIEEDANNFLEDLLSGCEKLLDQIKEEEKLSPARIEYYNLKINEIKNFKNTKNKEEENKKKCEKSDYAGVTRFISSEPETAAGKPQKGIWSLLRPVL